LTVLASVHSLALEDTLKLRLGVPPNISAVNLNLCRD
jgi:hypothetical protein